MSIKIGDNTIGGSPVVENTTGNSYTKTMSQASITNELENKADKNLVNTGFITNCITEIPQDIKLELNDGTLTLKAGSKVYIPNGFESDGTTPHFDIVILENDYNGGTGNGDYMYTWSSTLGIGATVTSDCHSGTTTPSNPGTNAYWYDIASNKIKRWLNSSWQDNGYSLPFCISHTTFIDQVFNGFGYIGSTSFVLPGVKALAPNGRNEDGTLKNQELYVNNVLLRTISGSNFCSLVITQSSINNHVCHIVPLTTYCQPSTTPPDPTKTIRWFNPNENKFYIWNTTTSKWQDDPQVHLCRFFIENAIIKSMIAKYDTFKALGESDKGNISAWSMPSDKYIELTLGASGTEYTAPANGWFGINCPVNANGRIKLAVVGKDGICNGFATGNTVSASGACIPVLRGDKVVLLYTNIGTVDVFRFYYTEGEI